ncbi:MAG: RagB/SusD family nutrient uptake outer membrane protein [Mediterranea sp.]|jgi:hypothetical protein|nr:RagB/SusD family nutrient uptake outer membrane protein [Mediterranea sp.]
MKKIHFYTPFIALLLGLGTTISSCGDSFLDEKMYSSYGTGNTDERSIETQLIGLHRTYAGLWGVSSWQGFLSCWQIGTDVASAGAVQGVETPFYQYANLNAENSAVGWLWQECYVFINNANIIIAAVGDSNPAAAAEARFFRAYAYNMLVTFWGDVPKITESLTVPRTDFTRDPVSSIDELIREDLEYAMANCRDMTSTADEYESRINKDMARQLAAEAYLRMGDYPAAEAAATAIINNTAYKLVEARYGSLAEAGDYYHDMFKWGKQRRSQGNTEAIWTFQLEYNRDVAGGTIDNPQHRRVWQPAYHKWSGMVNADSLGGRGNGRLRLSNFVKYGLYQEGDIRNSNYNIRRYTFYNKPGWSETAYINSRGFRVAAGSADIAQTITLQTGDRVIPFEADSLEVWYPHPTKWGSYDATDDFGYALVKDWPVMRLGETYLLRAEARLRQNNPGGAAADINMLRDRAFKDARIAKGDNTYGSVSASDMTIDFILDERVRELISEENRRMTLIRTGKLAERILLNGDATPAAPADKVITGFQEFNTMLPIPLTDIQRNVDAELTQNPGYN